jgi:hypothetical protein
LPDKTENPIKTRHRICLIWSRFENDDGLIKKPEQGMLLLLWVMKPALSGLFIAEHRQEWQNYPTKTTLFV